MFHLLTTFMHCGQAPLQFLNTYLRTCTAKLRRVQLYLLGIWVAVLPVGSALAQAGPGPDWRQVAVSWQQYERNIYPDSDRGVTLQATTLLSPDLMVHGMVEHQRFAEFADEQLRFTAYRLQLGARMGLNAQTDAYGLAGPLFWSRRWSDKYGSFQVQDTGFAGQLGVRMAVNPQLELGAALHHENIASWHDTFPGVNLRYQFMPGLGLQVGALFPRGGNRYQLGLSWSY